MCFKFFKIMKINTAFFVDKAKLAFFEKFFGIKGRDTFADANKELLEIEGLWKKEASFIDNLFLKIFGDRTEEVIKIYVFPQYFNLGAAETRAKIVLFGQPRKTDNFSSAIIAHEIGHIFLLEIDEKLPPIIGEAICYMLEDYICSVLDNKKLADVWKGEKLDLFHSKAMEIAIREIEGGGPIISRSAPEIIADLQSRLNGNILDLKPEKGLIKNIT